MIPKTGHFFENDCCFILAFRGLGKGYAAVKKFISIMNSNAPVTYQSWAKYTCSMLAVTEELLEKKS